MLTAAKTFTRIVGLSESHLLEYWANCLVSKKIWNEDVIGELLRTDFRVAAYREGNNTPIGFASVWTGGDPDPAGELNGHWWLDHMVKVDDTAPVSIQEVVYPGQVEFLKRQDPVHRIFRAPFHPSVVKFSVQRGWVKLRDPDRFAPNGVLELPRAVLG